MEGLDRKPIGQGLGGVAALELARAHPDRVRSLALVSAPGAQEFEMMGNPLVNKLVYGFHGAFSSGADAAAFAACPG